MISRRSALDADHASRANHIASDELHQRRARRRPRAKPPVCRTDAARRRRRV